MNRFTNQRFGRRRSRLDNTFKWNWVPVETKYISRGCYLHNIWFKTYVNNPVVNLGSSLRIFPWSSTGGLISYTARRQDAIEYNELSLKCLPGQILGKKFLMSAYGEYVVFTDRRPNPNAAQSGSLISGLSFPSFRYRSGWNSRGLSKTLGSFNIDLNEKFSTEIGLADHTNHALPIMIVPFGI